ncbi:RIN4 [Theobroma cacao]|nr:RIN4 [Theobroma cacao]
MDMSHVQLRSHVPKFGDWDNDNLPYTAYFENARKERAGIRMNPNDPEENPEAFMYTRGGLESNCDCQPVQVPPAAGSQKSIPADKNHNDGHSRQNAPNRNGSYDYQKSVRSHRSMASESGSEKSNSDHSLLRFSHRRANSGQKKGRVGGSSFSSSVSRQFTHRNGSYQSDNNRVKCSARTTASIPKFGEWDETDPTSGEGYTAIFNQVKAEKQSPTSKFPTVPPQQSNYSDCYHSKPRTPSFCSKVCCCLFSRGSD